MSVSTTLIVLDGGNHSDRRKITHEWYLLESVQIRRNLGGLRNTYRGKISTPFTPCLLNSLTGFSGSIKDRLGLTFGLRHSGVSVSKITGLI